MKIVIWGLRNTRHSHRYIHKGFFETFKRMGNDVVWVDDRRENQKYLGGTNLVIAVNIASEHIVNNSNNCYVTHNFDNPDFTNADNVLRLQVWTNESRGESIDPSMALYNQDSRTLYQPWGVPEPESEWMNPRIGKGQTEYWVGAVWNNSLNQGNQSTITQYRLALKDHGIRFRRVGGTRWLTKKGLSAKTAYGLVSRSPLGAAIVGEWQQSKGYIPCRIFKNVAAGSIPSSNSNFGSLFAETGIYNSDIGSLVTKVLQVSSAEKVERVVSAQSSLKLYKYENSIKRILDIVTNF